MPAKFTAAIFDIQYKVGRKMAKRSFSVTNPVISTKLAPIFSLGQAAKKGSCTDMLYSYKFSKVLPLALDAATTIVPASLNLGGLSKSLKPFDDLMDDFPLSLKMNSDLASKNLKYFAVSGTTEVHSLPASRASVNCCGAFVASAVAAFVDFAIDSPVRMDLSE